MILFGSYSRGDFTEESDIDIALLIDKMENISSERKKYLSAISRLSLKYDTVISVIPFDYMTFQSKRTPLILNVTWEGIKI